MLIRAEQTPDHDSVRNIHQVAFERPAEAKLVDALRLNAPSFVSLVAEHSNGASIGHIAFSPVYIDACPDVNLMGLAPMAVLPSFQNRGIGSALVRAGLDACRELKIQAVVVLGHPRFYPRFGFLPASGFGIDSQYDVPDEVLMATELAPGALEKISGTIQYHPAFEDL